MVWFLIFSIYTCTGVDPGIFQGNVCIREERVKMPSLEVCRTVRVVNEHSRCVAEVSD